ncbi:hypothetical protein UlMin_017263 [Ulmus minor]
MATATPTVIALPWKLWYSRSDYHPRNPAKNLITSTKFAIHHTLGFSSLAAKTSFPIQAQRQGQEDSTTTNNNGSQDDLDYLWKLAAGSIAGAAVIKYGSVVFPEITRPNITQALFMILAPCVVAVILLINQSRKK